jgi:hypothetical protein
MWAQPNRNLGSGGSSIPNEPMMRPNFPMQSGGGGSSIPSEPMQKPNLPMIPMPQMGGTNFGNFPYGNPFYANGIPYGNWAMGMLSRGMNPGGGGIFGK